MWTYILKPLEVIRSNKIDFLIWFLFSIIAGQLGIIGNIIIKYFAHDITLTRSLYLDSQSGSFYTFGIAIAASALGPLLANFINEEKPTFRTIKILTIIFSIFFLIIAGMIYAAVQTKSTPMIEVEKLVIDKTQASVYFLSIFVAIYSYCILKLSLPKFKMLNDRAYNQVDDDLVQSRIDSTHETTDDGAGAKI